MSHSYLVSFNRYLVSKAVPPSHRYISIACIFATLHIGNSQTYPGVAFSYCCTLLFTLSLLYAHILITRTSAHDHTTYTSFVLSRFHPTNLCIQCPHLLFGDLALPLVTALSLSELLSPAYLGRRPTSTTLTTPFPPQKLYWRFT